MKKNFSKKVLIFNVFFNQKFFFSKKPNILIILNFEKKFFFKIRQFFNNFYNLKNTEFLIKNSHSFKSIL